jgi:hypothetical protein
LLRYGMFGVRGIVVGGLLLSNAESTPTALQTGQNLTPAGDKKLCQGISADADQVNLDYC